MTNQHSDRATNRDDADARGEHQYPDDATRPKRQIASPFERSPEHYAAGANGTQQVTATPSSAKASGTEAKTGSAWRDAEESPGKTGNGQQEKR